MFLLANSSSYNFDFENVSSCYLLLNLPNSNTSWNIGNETTIAQIRNATNNHAFQNASGQFAYVDGSSMQPNNTACISTQTMHSTLNQTICLQFYFQMFGNDTKTLKVYKTNGSLLLDDATCIWQESMMSTHDWSFAQAEFNLSSTGRVNLILRTANSYYLATIKPKKKKHSVVMSFLNIFISIKNEILYFLIFVFLFFNAFILLDRV